MLDAKTIETSILRVNNDSFTGPLIIGTFEERAPGLGTRPSAIGQFFSLSQVTVTEVSAQFLSRFLSVEFINKLRAYKMSQGIEMCGSQNLWRSLCFRVRRKWSMATKTKIWWQ